MNQISSNFKSKLFSILFYVFPFLKAQKISEGILIDSLTQKELEISNSHLLQIRFAESNVARKYTKDSNCLNSAMLQNHWNERVCAWILSQTGKNLLFLFEVKNFGIELSSQEVPLQVLSSIYNVSQLSSRWISVVPLSTLKTPKQK